MGCMGASKLYAPFDDATINALKEEQAKGFVEHYSPWHPMPYVCDVHQDEILEVRVNELYCNKCNYSQQRCWDPLW